MANPVKKLTNINAGVVGSVFVGIALFGVVVWAVRQAPTNGITAPVKKAAEIVTS